MADESKPDVKPDVPDGGNQINVKVTQDSGTAVHFKIKKNTPLRKLMNTFCERQGIQKSSIRFVFDGVKILDHHTPEELDMEDEDTIEIFQEQTGGWP